MTRTLIGLVAVIGVVAMHGLTMNHDAAMASMNPDRITSVTLNASGAGHHSIMADARAMMSPIADMLPADNEASAAHVPRAGAAPTTHTMPTACLALFTGLLLLLGAGRLLTRRRSGTRDSFSRRNVAWFATAVERLRPDLAELSVLRT